MVRDEERAKCIMALIGKGRIAQIIVSHDAVFNWRREQFPSPEVRAIMESMANPCHFHDNVIPILKSMGADDRQIEMLLVDNPSRFFSGEPLSEAVL